MLQVAHLLCKSPCVLAGAPFAQAVFDYFSLQVTWHFADGAELDGSSSDKIVTAVVSGPARQVLMAERSALNILSRASGVATAAKKACAIAQQHSWAGMVAGTRKTTPGFRSVEKYALVVGGSATHRTDLSQMVMIKDNHIWSAGSITVAVGNTTKPLPYHFSPSPTRTPDTLTLPPPSNRKGQGGGRLYPQGMNDRGLYTYTAHLTSK